MSIADELEKLKVLHTAGTLSDQEFASAKAQLLGGSIAPVVSVPTPNALTPLAPSSAKPAEKRDGKTPKAGISLARIVIGVLAMVILLFIGLIGLRSMLTSSSGDGSAAAAMANLVLPPQIIFDEDLAVSASSWQARGFSLPSPRPVEIVVQGVSDTDKGFDVDLVDESNLGKLKREEQFEELVAFSSPKVRSISNRGTIAAGSYYLVIRNSYNILNTMTVHVKATVNPR